MHSTQECGTRMQHCHPFLLRLFQICAHHCNACYLYICIYYTLFRKPSTLNPLFTTNHEAWIVWMYQEWIFELTAHCNWLYLKYFTWTEFVQTRLCVLHCPLTYIRTSVCSALTHSFSGLGTIATSLTAFRP